MYLDQNNYTIYNPVLFTQKFYKYGKLSSEGKIDKDLNYTGLWKQYRDDGSLRGEGNYTNGMKTGVWKEYHENGTLESIGNYTERGGNRTGEWKEYHNNGQLWEIGEYNGATGFRVGFWKYYHDNGQISHSGKYNGNTGNEISVWTSSYKNGEFHYQKIYDDQGELNEEYIVKNENGTVYQKFDYIHGKLQNVLIYNDKEGNPLPIGTFSNGNGTLNEYIDGTLINKAHYADGTIQGEYCDIIYYWTGEYSSRLNSCAWKVYENEDSSTAELEFALKWVERSIELDKNRFNTGTYASLLYRTGNYTKALSIAKESIVLGEKAEEDNTSTENLIEKIKRKM